MGCKGPVSSHRGLLSIPRGGLRSGFCASGRPCGRFPGAGVRRPTGTQKRRGPIPLLPTNSVTGGPDERARSPRPASRPAARCAARGDRGSSGLGNVLSDEGWSAGLVPGVPARGPGPTSGRRRAALREHRSGDRGRSDRDHGHPYPGSIETQALRRVAARTCRHMVMPSSLTLASRRPPARWIRAAIVPRIATSAIAIIRSYVISPPL